MGINILMIRKKKFSLSKELQEEILVIIVTYGHIKLLYYWGLSKFFHVSKNVKEEAESKVSTCWILHTFIPGHINYAK